MDATKHLKWTGDWLHLRELDAGGQGTVFLVRRIPKNSYIELAKQIENEMLYAAGAVRLQKPPYPPVLDHILAAFMMFQNGEAGALKQLKSAETSRNAVAAPERLRREIACLRQISHPGLIRIIDSDADGCWYVMEYHERGALLLPVLNYRGDFFLSLRAIRPIVEGVAELHERSVVHRDIKPKNIFVTDDGRLVLGDFGLVIDGSAERLTESYENVGTRAFMPPWTHGHRLESVSPSVDTFALGKVIWCMVSGKHPFPNHYFRRDEFNLERIYPSDVNMRIANEFLTKCVVDEEGHGVRNGRELLTEIDRLLGNRAIARDPGVSTPELEVALLKRYFADPGSRFQSHELIEEATSELIKHVPMFSSDGPFSDEELLRRVELCERSCSKLAKMFAVGCRWATPDMTGLWVSALDRIAAHATREAGLVAWTNLQRYPLTILLYSGGISAWYSNNCELIGALALRAKLRLTGGAEPIIKRSLATEAMSRDVGRHLPGLAHHKTPTSERLYEQLRPILVSAIPEEAYEHSFDQFEYLLALLYVHASGGASWRPTYGRFAWKRDIVNEFEADALNAKEKWPAVQAGLFAGSFQEYLATRDKYAAWLQRVEMFSW